MELVTDQNIRRIKSFLKWLIRVTLAFVLLLIFTVVSLWIYAKILGPPPIKVPQTTEFLTADNKVFAEAEHGNQNRYWVNINHISKPVTQATVAVEDKRFYHHHGFDIKRIFGSIVADVTSFSKSQGASTLTMQYARNLYLSNDKTWKRKFLEMFYTMRLESNYSKKDILEGYLNTVYYGHGAYGIQAASKYYFDKPAKDLTLAEASLLAGVPNGPSYFAPDDHFDNAKKRQRIVLQAMVNSHYITKAEAAKAFNQHLTILKKHPASSSIAPYFEDAVQNELHTKLGLSESDIATGGLKVYTTLNTDLQEKANKWVKQVIAPDSRIETALVSMNPKTGAVEAMVGGRDYSKDQYNLAVQAKRQPGSSFKPFLYYAALRNGFTPSSTLTSEPTTFTYDDGHQTYSPENYGGYYAGGPITLMQALALSDNIFAVKTHLAIGMDKLVSTAHKMGISSPLSAIPSLALGTKEVSVLEMARAYSTIANLGARVSPNYITKVVNREGDVIYQWHPEKKQVLDKATSFVLSQMMTGIFDPKLNDYTTVTGNSVKDILTHKVAAKTGTTNTDSWMVGFTPKITTAVWVGYKEHQTLSTYPDSRYSKKLWANYMESALEGQPKNSFKAPKGVVKAWVDPDTGKLATDACPNARLTYYVKGTEPTEYCDKHHGTPYKKEKDKGADKKGKGLINKILDLFPW
ncbi:penicillin-binding protein [Pullulanibacillus camelliae]|uniref:Penicillin-binding protein n=1 Tax=Pullulanibacillus camelliae TaxID=1707096 RepID=A0A8J2VJE6_9BACL|nr:transglycosylase domain-containing protein [Pullulanibacillus camelliae]GGE28737.1 penicillin-binding protein [Pullulanibacillus camelliae]